MTHDPSTHDPSTHDPSTHDPMSHDPLLDIGPDPIAGALPATWTRDHVGARLVDAFRTLDKLPRVAGPRRAGNHWPHHAVEFSDLVAQAELPEAERRERVARRNTSAFRPSGREIDQMDRALDWLRELKAADPDLASAVAQWALYAARRRSIRALCRTKGWVPASFYLLRARALDLLAATLNTRGVAVF